MSESEIFVRRWFDEVWNKQNVEELDRMLADHLTIDGLANNDGSPVTTKDEFRELFRQFCNSFPDLHIDVLETMSQDNRAFARFSLTGTHDGDGLGIAPTGAKVDFDGTVTIEVEDGKLTKASNTINFLLMFQQLGAVQMVNPTAGR